MLLREREWLQVSKSFAKCEKRNGDKPPLLCSPFDNAQCHEECGSSSSSFNPELGDFGRGLRGSRWEKKGEREEKLKECGQ